jgi:hypothetical protein
MRSIVIIVAVLMILGLAAFGVVSAQKGANPTATAASTVGVASATQKVPALPARAPVRYDEMVNQQDKLSSNNTGPAGSVVRTIGK